MILYHAMRFYLYLYLNYFLIVVTRSHNCKYVSHNCKLLSHNVTIYHNRICDFVSYLNFIFSIVTVYLTIVALFLVMLTIYDYVTSILQCIFISYFKLYLMSHCMYYGIQYPVQFLILTNVHAILQTVHE